MSNRIEINADVDFVEKMMQKGGGDLNKCYQCSTCTVVCPLTPQGTPFPRKEMITSQWGIKEKLVNSMDPWLCHNCNDCSDQCPRDAKPGDVMSAIRSMTIEHFSSPNFIAKAAANNSQVGILLLIPIILIAAVIFIVNGGSFEFLNSDPIVFSKMLSVSQIDMIFLPAAAFAAFGVFTSIKKFLAGLKADYPPTGNGESLGNAIKGTIGDIISHVKFKECGVAKSRNTGHMLMMWGFIGLFITTNMVIIIHYGHTFMPEVFPTDTPLPFLHPAKIFGNLSAVAATLGVFMLIKDRMGSMVAKSSAFDWIFLIVMALTIVTGILAQAIRVAGIGTLAYFVYYLHLVFVFFIICYAPQTKLGHIFFRPVAMIYARYSGREKELAKIADTRAKEEDKA